MISQRFFRKKNRMKIEEIIGIVREASSLMVRKGFEIKDKGSNVNIVTSSDLAVQHFLTNKLGELLPGSGFLCEEENMIDTKHSYVWIIDPIDGTANYARGIASCCISVALAHDGEVVAGVVCSPWRGETYWAEKGRGSFCNGEPLHVSDRPFENGLLFSAMSTYRKEFAKTCSDIIFDIYMQSNDFRRTGSAAVELSMMAAGRAELYFEMRLMPWDYAAGGLILQEAGGVICDFEGKTPSLTQPSLIIAANDRDNLNKLVGIVRKHMPDLPY